MKNKIIIVILIIILILTGIYSYNIYRVKTAKRKVKLKYNKVEVYSNIKLSNIIKSINGRLIEDKKIDTTKLGKKDITFKYINNDNIKVDYKITIYIEDKTPPVIYRGNTYKVNVGESNLEKELFCGDNYDSSPKCFIEGDYNTNIPGTYDINFIGIDSSNNTSTQNIKLIVTEKQKSSSNIAHNTIDYNDIVKNYKTKNTSIGIDVSHWQGKIDYNKLKGKVDFVYIRVGRNNGEKFILDDKFKDYIKGFNKANIPVGVYFYSNAKTKKESKREAEWVLKEIKDYKVEKEIVFDWENWDNFQDYNLSFYELTSVAKEFERVVKKSNYNSLVYSSKSYLENIWYDLGDNIWLAHYTDKTDYKGKYKVWQLCNNGKLDGIENDVDIDIAYNN